MSTRISLLPTSAESRRETSTLRGGARARGSAQRVRRARRRRARRAPHGCGCRSSRAPRRAAPAATWRKGCPPSAAAPGRRRRILCIPPHRAWLFATMPSASTIDVNAGSDRALKDRLILMMPIDLVDRIVASRPYTSLEHMRSVVDRRRGCGSYHGQRSDITSNMARRLRFGTPRGAAVGKRRARVDPESSSSAMRKHRAKTKTPPPPHDQPPGPPASSFSHTRAAVPSKVDIILDIDITDID